MAKKIQQLIIKEPSDTNVIEGCFVTKLGIQGEPGTGFVLNSSPIENNVITIGQYGIYELDLTNLGGLITSLIFPETEWKNNHSVIVDIVYEGGTAI